MNKLLVIQAAVSPFIADYILAQYGAELIEKAKEIQSDLSSPDLCMICAEGHKGMEGIRVIHTPSSPVLENGHAVASVMKGKLARPMITEEIPQAEEKELMILTLEELFYMCHPTEGGFLELFDGMDRRVVQASFSSNLEEILQTADISEGSYLLVGGLEGNFILSKDAQNQLFEKDGGWNFVRI